MATPADSILPAGYFSAVSDLWGGCVLVASAIAAGGFAFSVATTARRQDPVALIRLILKIVMIGLVTAFLRDWLLRLNDVIGAFNDALGVDPAAIASQYLDRLKGLTGDPKSTIWDVIWKTGSFGTAIAYALIWLFGWIAWGVQFFVRLFGDILLTMGWALSPIFLAFFMVRPLSDVARKYILGLVAVTCWPFGWAVAAVVTKALLDLAASASLLAVVLPGDAMGPVLVSLLIGLWIILSAPLAPYTISKVLLMGVNPASAMFGAAGGVAQAGVVGGIGAAATASSGGAVAPVVIAAALAGAAAASSESAARGGRAAILTSAMTRGYGSYVGGTIARRNLAANEMQAASTVVSAEAARRTATAARDYARAHQQAAEGIHRAATAHEDIAAAFRGAGRNRGRSRPGYHEEQPHQQDPDEIAAIIARRARSMLLLPK